MNLSDAKPTQIRYDMKKPCKDCPFLVNSELHQGIANSLMAYHGHMEKGNFAHTCHKTDPRADSPEGKRFKGQARHCTGALAMQMQEKMPYQNALDHALIKRKCDPDALNAVEGLWPSFIHMMQAYARWLKAGIPEGARGTEYLR